MSIDPKVLSGKFFLAWVMFSIGFILNPESAKTQPAPKEDRQIIVYTTVTAGSKAFLLYLANLEQEPTTVNISSLDGQNYFEKKIYQHNGFSMNISLEKIPKGRYVLSVKQNDFEKKQLIVVTETMVLLSKSGD